MAKKKISQMAPFVALEGTDLLHLADMSQGVSVKMSINDLITYLNANLSVDVNVSNLSYNSTTKDIVLTETDGTVHTINVSDLVDTLPSGTSNGDILSWNGTAWVATVGSINSLTDVDTVTITPTSGQVLSWNGTNWVPSTPAVSGWGLTGNAGTNPTTNFVGTTNAQDFVIRTNGTEKVRVTTNGRILMSNTPGSNTSLFIGQSSGNTTTTAQGNVAVGRNTLSAVTTAANNVAIGYNSQLSTTTGGTNVSVGRDTLRLNTNGSANVAIGHLSLKSNTSGYENVAVGFNTLGQSTIANQLVAIGSGSLSANTTGEKNTAVGTGSLSSNTTGTHNNAFGYTSLAQNTTGANNSSFGYGSLYNNTTGNYNVSIGNGAAKTDSLSNAVSIANSSTFLGALTKPLTDNESNQTVIGFAAVGNGSNTFTFGNNSITKHIFTSGNVGIGAINPGNKLEITHGTANNSGLRFTNLTSASTAGASSGKVLSLNATGDVVLETASSGGEKRFTSPTVNGGISGASFFFAPSGSSWSPSLGDEHKYALGSGTTNRYLLSVHSNTTTPGIVNALTIYKNGTAIDTFAIDDTYTAGNVYVLTSSGSTLVDTDLVWCEAAADVFGTFGDELNFNLTTIIS